MTAYPRLPHPPHRSAPAPLAQAVGRFDERPVSPQLAMHFSHVWRKLVPATARPAVVVVPDGCIDLMWIDGRLSIAGPDSAPQTETVTPGTALFGFRFRPGAAAAWLGVAARDLHNRRVALADIWGSRVLRLEQRAADSEAAVARVLEAALATQAPAWPRHDAAMTAAYRLIAAGAPAGGALLPRLTDAVGLSERTLRRRCEDAFGYGPKTLDRVLRFQRFLQLVQLGRSGSIAALAAEAGYADQPHLVRETRRLAGTTPGALAAVLGDGRPHGGQEDTGVPTVSSSQ